jgi:hypothetical protein
MNLGPVVQPQPPRRRSFARRAGYALQILFGSLVYWFLLALISLTN